MTHDLSTPAQFLKGVGPKRYELLKKLGIVTVRDLLHHFPRGYLDRSVIKPIAQAREGTIETVRGEVLKSHVRRTRSGPQIAEVLVGDDSGVIAAVWFNMPFMAK
ncbi:MAG: DNA helicase RecG, partial [Planctomycetes bacterium]|nr:DNA helicase RecG [Planctomycetota bacterium]